MWITVKNKNSTEIDSRSVKQILDIYPEENLSEERRAFIDAFQSNSIEFKVLVDEADKIMIPWQLFFLDRDSLKEELRRIDKMRADKTSNRLFAKRKGSGDITSKRIVDRVIQLQNFVSDNFDFPVNLFCGSLVGMSDQDAIYQIISYFNFDINFFRKLSKERALKYLIEKIENNNINVSQGVLTNKILPNHQVVKNSVYKNTSGFVIRDEKIPFIFLPSETNPDEVSGRQIYTLIYLIVLIGLNQYDFFLKKDFAREALAAKGKIARIYRITSELLLPSDVTDELKGVEITSEIRDELASTYKMTPTAVLVTLKLRECISSQEKYEELLPPIYIAPKVKKEMNPPKIETSVKKFCGKHAFILINKAIKSGGLSSIQAQYLLFGSVNKKGFKEYRKSLKI